MRINASCLKCIIDVRIREILNSKLSDKAKFEAIKKFLKYISEIAVYNDISTNIGSLAFKKVKELIRDEDPYYDYKIKSEQIAYKLLPYVKDKMMQLKDYERFRFLAIISINANSIDPGIAVYDFRIEDLNKLLFHNELAIDHLKEAYDFILNNTHKVLYLLDNCGEAIFDMLLIDELKSLGKEVWAVVKSFAYQNDVTIKDAKRIGLDKVANKILETGSDYSGLLPGTYSKKVENAIKECDLIISKGMAHYETLSEFKIGKPILYLLKAKCEPVANTLGVKTGSNVALFIRQG